MALATSGRGPHSSAALASRLLRRTVSAVEIAQNLLANVPNVDCLHVGAIPLGNRDGYNFGLPIWALAARDYPRLLAPRSGDCLASPARPAGRMKGIERFPALLLQVERRIVVPEFVWENEVIARP